MDNVDEMDKFSEKYNFPKLSQEEIKNLNRLITSTEIETVIRNLLANKSPGPTYLEKRKHISYSNSSRKIAEEGKLPNSFYEATMPSSP